MKWVFALTLFFEALVGIALAQDGLVNYSDRSKGQDHPMVIRPKGHKGIVWSLELTSDEKYVITAGQDKTIKVWDIEHNFALRGEFLGHIGSQNYGAVYAASVSPNQKYLAAAGFFGDSDNPKMITQIRVYDFQTRKILGVLEGHKNVIGGLNWTKNSRFLISASRDKSARVWDVDKLEQVLSLEGHGDVVNDAHILGTRIVTGSKDNLIIMWDLASGQPIKTSYDHLGEVKHVIFSPDGQYIISSARDNQINIYDTQLNYLNSLFLSNTATTLSFSADGKYLLAGFNDGAVKVYSFTGSNLVEVAGHKAHERGFVAGVEMTSDGKLISIGGIDSNMAVYHLKGNTLRKVLSKAHSTQKVWSAAIKDELMVFSTGRSGLLSGIRNVDFTKGFHIISRDYRDLEETGSNIMTMTFGAGITDLKATYRGKKYDFKTAVRRKGALYAIQYPNKIVVNYDPQGNDASWTIQKGKFTGYKSGQIVTQIIDNVKKHGVVFTPDSLLVVSGSAGYLKAFDLSGKLVSTFLGHEDAVFSINISNNEKWIISGSHDHSIRLWDTDKIGKYDNIYPAATCYFSQDGEWIVATDQGYYMSSTHGGKYIGFHQNQGFKKEAKYYPFENFDLKYNRPDKVLERLEMGSENLRRLLKQAYEKRVRKMGIAEEALSDELNLPMISIKTTTQSVTDKLYELEVVAQDARFDLNRLNVYVNDVPIYGSSGIYLKKSTKVFQKVLQLELLPGKNKIQVSALNSAGVESLKETVDVYFDGPKQKPNLHIVTIGVSNYKDSNYNLDYAAKDATDVANLFHGRYERYNRIYLHKFTDALAQREQILAIKEKLNNTQIKDEVIIFAAGHGLLDENLDYYFATHDIDFENPAARGLKYEALEGLLDGIPARRKLLFIDACHSGEVDKEEVELVKTELQRKGVSVRGFAKKPQPAGIDNVFELMQELFADLRRGTGAMVISSSAGLEFALESEQWKNGVFTYALLEGLSSGKCDTDKDGVVKVSELKEYVFSRVVELTNGRQHPTSRRENLESDFVVW